jgi:hypothetical protein
MRRKFSFTLSSFLVFLIAFTMVLPMVHAQASAANAFTPVTTIIPIDSTFINDFDCSFPLVEQVNGAIRDTLFFDQNGVVVREYISPQFQGALTVTWTNPQTGISLESHEASAMIIYYNPDGSFQKLMNQGLTFMVTVPGAGEPILVDVGRIVIQRGKGITFEAGSHEELYGETAAFCEYLAGSY